MKSVDNMDSVESILKSLAKDNRLKKEKKTENKEEKKSLFGKKSKKTSIFLEDDTSQIENNSDMDDENECIFNDDMEIGDITLRASALSYEFGADEEIVEETVDIQNMEEDIINSVMFDLINSEEENRVLAENLNNFNILNLNNSSNTDNYIVKGASELLKSAILSTESSKLFKSKYHLIDYEKKSESDFALYTNLFKYFILKINEKLEYIINKLETDKILIQIEKEQKSKIESIINKLKEIINKDIITDDDYNILNKLQKDAKDLIIYSSDKLEQNSKKSYLEIINNVNENYLTYNIYEFSLEILIYINIASSNYYTKILNFKEADNIINEMINTDSSFNKTIKESKYWQKCIIDDVLFLRSFSLHKDSHLLDPSLLDILKNVLSGKPISLLFGRVDESMLNRYDDINHNTSLYLENNFCCYIELLRDIKNIMNEEIYILEINDIKYLIFKNNYN